MFCRQCGTKLQATAKFCEQCGAAVASPGGAAKGGAEPAVKFVAAQTPQPSTPSVETTASGTGGGRSTPGWLYAMLPTLLVVGLAVGFVIGYFVVQESDDSVVQITTSVSTLEPTTTESLTETTPTFLTTTTLLPSTTVTAPSTVPTLFSTTTVEPPTTTTWPYYVSWSGL